MGKSATQIAKEIVDGESKVVDGLDLTKVNWFEVLQGIQSLMREEVEEEEECNNSEREEQIQKLAYQRVWSRASQMGVSLLFEYPG